MQKWFQPIADWKMFFNRIYWSATDLLSSCLTSNVMGNTSRFHNVWICQKFLAEIG